MDALLNLRTFLAVVRCGGFSEAARQLHVVPSVAAKRITQLEKTTGARLFDRSTRGIKITEAGQQLLSRAADLVSDFDAVVHGLQRDESKLEGHIRLMAPTTLTLFYLGDVLNAFLREHERITMEIALVDRSISPLEEGFDMAISGRSSTYEGVIDVPLCPVNLLLCAAPAYLQRRGVPAHPRELPEHDCLVFKPAGPSWLFQSNLGLISTDIRARLACDDNHTLLQAAKAAQGIATLPAYLAKDALKTGELRLLLKSYPLQETWFKAYVPRRRQGLARIKALTDWLLVHMQGLELVAKRKK